MSTPANNGWTRCSPGTFRRLAANLAARRLRRLWLTGLAWAAGAIIILAASWQTAEAINSWLFDTRPKPGVPCAPSSPTANPITPDGHAPAPGCGR